MKYTTQGKMDLSPLMRKLINTTPLMRTWQDSRTAIFFDQFENELDPEDKPLRDLSAVYLAWKNAYFPGRKKRELTGRTLRSRQIRITRNTVTETFGFNGVFLQKNLDLPLQPEEWNNPTLNRFLKDAELFLEF